MIIRGVYTVLLATVGGSTSLCSLSLTSVHAAVCVERGLRGALTLPGAIYFTAQHSSCRCGCYRSEWFRFSIVKLCLLSDARMSSYHLTTHNTPPIDLGLHVLWPIRLNLSAFSKSAHVNKPYIFWIIMMDFFKIKSGP